MSSFSLSDHHIFSGDRSMDINVTLKREHKSGELVGAILHIDRPMTEDQLGELIGKGKESWLRFFTEA